MTAVVIGYGNPLRGDDGAGPAVAETVAAWGLAAVRALAVVQLTPDLAEVVAESSIAIFVDAWTGSADVNIEVLPVPFAEHAGSLVHTSNPGVLLALASAVYGRCPPAWMIRIPAMHYDFAVGLSPAVNLAVAAALRAVIRLVSLADSGSGEFVDEVSVAAPLQRKDCQ
jgi:hydrogenase maturation protease